MAGMNQRRATGTHLRFTERMTRRDFLDEVSRVGGTAVRERLDVGEWNERVVWTVNGTVVLVTMRSESPNWTEAVNAVRALRGAPPVAS